MSFAALDEIEFVRLSLFSGSGSSDEEEAGKYARIELSEKPVRHLTGDLLFTSTIFNFTCAYGGIIHFYTPLQGKFAGVLLPVVFHLISFVINVETGRLIIDSSQEWKAIHPEQSLDCYEALVGVAFGTTAKAIVVALQVLYLMLANVALLMFNYASITFAFGLEWDYRWVALIQAPVLAFALCRKLAKLQHLSAVMCLAILVSMAASIVQSAVDVRKWSKWEPVEQQNVFNIFPEDLWGALRAMTFVAGTYGIHFAILPQAVEMAEPWRCNRALFISTLGNCVMHVTLFVLGYLAYGQFLSEDGIAINAKTYPANAQEAFNLRPEQWTGGGNPTASTFIWWSAILGNFFRTTFTFFVTFKTYRTLSCVSDRISDGSFWDYFLMVALILVALAGSCVFPSLDVALSLIGCVVDPFLSCIFPIAVAWKLKQASGSARFGFLRAVFHMLCILYSLGTLVFGLTATLRRVVRGN